MSDDFLSRLDRLIRELAESGAIGKPIPPRYSLVVKEVHIHLSQQQSVEGTRRDQKGTVQLSPAVLADLLLSIYQHKESKMIEFPDPGDFGALAAWTAAMLAAYAGPAFRKVLDELQDRTVKGIADRLHAKTTEVWSWIKGRFQADPVRRKQLEAFEQAPEARKDKLAALLEEHLESDEEFRKSLQPMLEELSAMQKQLPASKTSYGQQIVIVNGMDHSQITQIQGNGNTKG